MRYVALGDLVVDRIYQKNGQEINLVKVDGGSSRFNVIANLAARNNNTYVISACGKDIMGKIALNSLERLNVDTSDVIIKPDIQTRAYHLIIQGNYHKSTKICPICGTKTWYKDPIVTKEYCKSLLRDDDVLILDGLKPENIPIITEFLNEKVIDIGRIKRLENLSNQEILNILNNRNIQIMQLNETVEKYLIKRFKINDILDVYNILNPNLLIVTRGRNGAEFAIKNRVITKTLKTYKREIDDTGAGDAFFSMFIQCYYDNRKNVTREWLDTSFDLANELTAKVVSHLGARGHLYDDYYLRYINKCICK